MKRFNRVIKKGTSHLVSTKKLTKVWRMHSFFDFFEQKPEVSYHGCADLSIAFAFSAYKT